MAQHQEGKKGRREALEADKVRSVGKPSKPPRAKSGKARTSKRSSWWAQVVSNLLAIVVLYLLLFWPFYRASCVPPHVSAASLALIFWSFAQLVWRHIPDAVDAAPIRIFGISITLPKVLDALQLRWLKTWFLLLLLAAAAVLGLSPISPFRLPEILPIVLGFQIQQSGQVVRQVDAGRPVSIKPEVAHIKVITNPPNSSCEWTEKKGLAHSGCTASYLPPSSKKEDVISVQITSPCGAQSRSATMKLEIREPPQR